MSSERLNLDTHKLEVYRSIVHCPGRPVWVVHVACVQGCNGTAAHHQLCTEDGRGRSQMQVEEELGMTLLEWLTILWSNDENTNTVSGSKDYY